MKQLHNLLLLLSQVKADDDDAEADEEPKVPEDAVKAEPVEAGEDEIEGETKEAPAEGKDELWR